MKRSIQNLLRLAMVTSAALALSSCLTVKGNLTPKVNLTYEEPLVDSGLVYIEAEFYRLVEGQMNEPDYVAVQTENFLDQVAQVTEASNPFAVYSLNPADKDNADYIVHFEVLHTYNGVNSTIAMSISYTTLGIIPTAIKDNYELELIVTDRMGRQIHKRDYEDYTRTWMHLIFLPFGQTLKTTTNKVLSNMVLASYRHLQFNEELLAGELTP